MAVYTLFTVSGVFIITLFPNAFISIILWTNYMTVPNLQLFCVLRIIDRPFQIVRLVNYAINLILYGLTGRQFRTELYAMFSSCKTACRQRSNRADLERDPHVYQSRSPIARGRETRALKQKQINQYVVCTTMEHHRVQYVLKRKYAFN